ncbi:MAG: UDP-3-O-[3-hydroxymyristoyl] N-acetylglucosamine deacetylase [Synergistetes bacterium]|nr:UDP-3-O-[3-hydroxymyristoyl] N-acetylglucosamine deacetylase [Synergistota bacterium]
MLQDRQTTIRRAVSCEGRGLHTGERVKLIFLPADADTGIIFRRTDLDGRPEVKVDLRVSNVEVKRGTVLVGNGIKFFTVEHLLSAVVGMGVDNLIIELDNVEPPAMDGSAKPFVELIESAGIRHMDTPARYVCLKEAVWVDDGGGFIAAIPDERLKISYMIDFYHPLVGTQFISQVMDKNLYKNRIAPARTFGFAYEIDELYARGLAKGGSLENAVVIGEYDILNPEGLRFEDEFVRHKVLDLMGDITFLNGRLRAHIVVLKGGHAMHLKLIKRIVERGCL